MGLQCKLGAAGWDAIGWVRAKTEDAVEPFQVADSSYATYIESAVEDFSRFYPLDAQIGDVFNNTSPLVTVANQTRYVCSVANGFASEPDRIVDLLYRSGPNIGLNAANDLAYLYMSPFSSPKSFLGTGGLDQPADRVLRDYFFQELLRYGRGRFGVVRDGATGLLAFDLYPTPTQSGLPIFVRYQYSHQNTPDGQNNPWYRTVPSNRKRVFARMLYIAVLEEEYDAVATTGKSRLGIIQYEGGDPASLGKLLQAQDAKLEEEMGVSEPAVIVG
jgi:hypothetical protein